MLQGSILIVEDDEALLHRLQEALFALRLQVDGVSSGEQALQRLADKPYEIVLLDWSLPGMGGMAACRIIRDLHTDVAIIVLTAQDREDDKVNALEAGADDYISSPFHLPQLVARIESALRRIHRGKSDVHQVLVVGDIELDPVRHRVLKRKASVRLTPTEFELLRTLMSNAGKPVSHRALLVEVWGAGHAEEREYVRTYVNTLRKKLEEEPSNPRYILTENHIGYRFAVPGE